MKVKLLISLIQFYTRTNQRAVDQPVEVDRLFSCLMMIEGSRPPLIISAGTDRFSKSQTTENTFQNVVLIQRVIHHSSAFFIHDIKVDL